MRLIELRLHNFRSFKDETVAISPGTVLVGANNAGKTTIVEALSFLLRQQDDDVATWSYEALRPRSPWASKSHEPIAVVGRFDSLTPKEATAWPRAHLSDGSLRLGVVAVPESAGEREDIWVSSGRGPYLLMDHDQFVELSGSSAGDFPQVAGHLPFTGDSVVWISPVHYAELTGAQQFPAVGPTLVVVPGPAEAAPQIHDLLRPLLAEAVNRSSGDGVGVAWRLILDAQDAGQEVAAHLNAVLDSVEGARFRATPEGLTFGPSPDELAASLVRFDVAGVDPLTSQRLGRQGTGATRAALLAALQLYCSPRLWPASERSVILAIEEPEAGIHPALQREVARTLRDLPARGVQTVITTHSPVFIDAASPDGIRVVRSTTLGGKVSSGGSESAIRELGTRPSDVLLGEHFLIVEGQSDADVLAIWARTLGLDLDRAGVRIVPAGSADAVHVVSRIAAIAFPGARYIGLFDNDAEGHKQRAKMAAEMPDIPSVMWTRGAIESYFSRRAVELWARLLKIKEGTPADLSVAEPITLTTLKKLARAAGLRDFPKVEAGQFIAGQMTRDEIDAEVVAVLASVTSLKDSR